MDEPRFTDARVSDAGLRQLFAIEHRWQRWLDVERALADAQAELGIVPRRSAAAIAAAADLARLDVDRIRRGIAETSHPLMALIIELSEAAGEPHGGWVHWGATTQNVMQTGDVLVLREAHRRLLDLLAGVLGVAADLAERGAEMVMAGRTHGQHAVPITFGFKVAVWIDEIIRHVTRLRHAGDHAFVAMTGGGGRDLRVARVLRAGRAGGGRATARPAADERARPQHRRSLRRVRLRAWAPGFHQRQDRSRGGAADEDRGR